MRYRLLGPVAVEGDDGAPIVIPAPKRRALLAALLLNANRPVSTDELIAALWADDPPPAAVQSLHAHVSRLRAELGPGRIETEQPGYRVRVAAGELDLTDFERLSVTGRAALRAGRWKTACDALTEALSLWRGAALADVRDGSPSFSRAAALDEARLAVTEDRIEAQLRVAPGPQLVEELAVLTRSHAERERLWQQLMLALYRAGRQVDALAAYRELRDHLVDELGIDPSPELQELEARILRQDPSLAAPDAMALQPSIRLPAWLSPIIGRDGEIAELQAMVREDRLVTLTGPGGVGKTRLAVEIAHRLIGEYPDGVLFVDLSALRDPALVLSTIGLEIGGGERPWDVILDRHLLLVLDNFEQVLDAAAGVITLLDRCPRLHVVVTSRAALRLRGECVFDVVPLSADRSAELFTARAHEAMRRWETRPGEVAAIASRLDGLPLAIELTAARIVAFAPAALLRALDRPLEVMASGPRDAPIRHRALRDAIAWSYELLGEPARSCLRALSAFAGGFEMPAAVAVAGATMATLAELVEHSLVRRDGARYSLLETIREFAQEEALARGDAEAARDRHLAYHVSLFSADPGEATPDIERPDWLSLCRRERDNLRVAFAWAQERDDGEAILRLAKGVAFYWLIVGSLQEGEQWSRAAVARTSASRPLERAEALMLLAEFPRWSGRHQEAIELRQEGIGLAREAGDPEILATLLDDLAWSLGGIGHTDEAEAALREALELRASLPNDHRGVAHTLAHFGWLRIRQGRAEEALELARETRANEAQADLPPTTATETDDLEAAALLASGRLNEAKRLYEQVLTGSIQMDFRVPMLDALVGLATVDAGSNPERAVRYVGMADRVRAQSGLEVFDPAQFEAIVEGLRKRLGTTAYDQLWLVGHAAPPGVLKEQMSEG